jgi:hypothetical protein
MHIEIDWLWKKFFLVHINSKIGRLLHNRILTLLLMVFLEDFWEF